MNSRFRIAGVMLVAMALGLATTSCPVENDGVGGAQAGRAGISIGAAPSIVASIAILVVSQALT